mmetsp:Transcript_86093/g.230462  ORF Transcript_86093/g.230462 Transcript_86093/m.230462 type:complete len:211 (-) Transcript_86093:310-942(-)
MLQVQSFASPSLSHAQLAEEILQLTASPGAKPGNPGLLHRPHARSRGGGRPIQRPRGPRRSPPHVTRSPPARDPSPGRRRDQPAGRQGQSTTGTLLQCARSQVLRRAAAQQHRLLASEPARPSRPAGRQWRPPPQRQDALLSSSANPSRGSQQRPGNPQWAACHLGCSPASAGLDHALTGPPATGSPSSASRPANLFGWHQHWPSASHLL